jgi:Fe-S cluster biogenesis protein NfuA
MPHDSGVAIDQEQFDRVLANVRSLARGHGGDLSVTDIEDGIVSIAFHGACEACPNIAMTYVGPVRTALLQVPGVRQVRSADVHASSRALARIARALGAAEITGTDLGAKYLARRKP